MIDLAELEPNVARGYTQIPTADVERYVSKQVTTFGWGVVLGLAAGALLGRTLAPPRRLVPGLGGLRSRRRRRR